MWQQVLIFIGNMFKGDFGISYTIQKNLPISTMLAVRFPVSIRIGAMGFLVGVTLGFILGTFAALKHNTPLDTGASVLSMIGGSIPSDVLGMLLLYYIAYKFKWVPLWYSEKAPFLTSILPALAMAIGLALASQAHAEASADAAAKQMDTVVVTATGSRFLDLFLRYGRKRKILSELRQSEAGRGRLDLFLRYGK